MCNFEIVVLEVCREFGMMFVVFLFVGCGLLCGMLCDLFVLFDSDLCKSWLCFVGDNWVKNFVFVDVFGDIV